MKQFDVTTLGELLIDFVEHGESDMGNGMYEANPGGAPCNVLACLAKLGHKTSFIGKVGEDSFGTLLEKTALEVGIDTKYLYHDRNVHTTLAFVYKQSDGDRDFSFYRNPGADMMLCETEIPKERIADSRIFHFGTLSMTHEEVRKATKKAVQFAEETGALISFDPNLRLPLWPDLEIAREQVLYGLEHCQILKIADNELIWLTGCSNYTDGWKWIMDRREIPLVLVTMGKDGSRAYYHGEMVEVPSVVKEKAIETTGAGDTFLGSALHYILEYGLEDLTQERLREMLLFANAAAGIITTRRGALKVMPEREEIMSKICLFTTER